MWLIKDIFFQETYWVLSTHLPSDCKNVFSQDKAAVEAEVERLKPLVDLGGYIPCPDHRIAPDAKFELVQYYCDLMRKI